MHYDKVSLKVPSLLRYDEGMAEFDSLANSSHLLNTTYN